MPLGIFSTPKTSAAVVLAGADRTRRELERGSAACAAGLDVDDRHAGECERAEDLVTRRDTAVRGSAERRLERGVTGFRERGAHGVYAHVGRGLALESTERVETGSGYANAHVTTPSGSSSATSVIGRPYSSLVGSASRKRVITRSFSFTSSTTPKP